MYVMQIDTHSPESCPAFNKENKKTTVYLMQQMDSLLAKHGVKTAGMWTDHGAHTTYTVYDTPSMDAFVACMMEPNMEKWLAFSTVETRMVMGAEEVTAMLLAD